MKFIKSHEKAGVKEILFWSDLAMCHYAEETMEWYAGKNVKLVPRECNHPNCPELRPIELYWAIIKAHLRRSSKMARNLQHFASYWRNASAKVSEVLVKRMVGRVKRKVRLFGRPGIMY